MPTARSLVPCHAIALISSAVAEIGRGLAVNAECVVDTAIRVEAKDGKVVTSLARRRTCCDDLFAPDSERFDRGSRVRTEIRGNGAVAAEGRVGSAVWVGECSPWSSPRTG
jgi:hypothetical protein